MTPACSQSGCSEAGRWEVGDRHFCSFHGIAESTRGSLAMRLVCPIVEPPSVWDQLEQRVEEVRADDARLREMSYREIAVAAIRAGREGSR